MSGTLTIDTTTGTATAVNVALSSPVSGTYTVLGGYSVGAAYYALGALLAGSPSYPNLTLAIPGNTLVGYTGGALCSLASTCGGIVGGVWEDDETLSRLSSGSLTAQSPSTSVPALSPWALGALTILLGAFAVLMLRRAVSIRG